MSLRTCIHVKTNGLRCDSPALRHSTKCYHHHPHRRRTLKRRAVAMTLRSRGGRMAAIEQVLHGVHTNRMDPQVARTMLYAIQLGTDIGS